MIAVTAVVLGLVASCYGAGTLTYKDCNTSPNKLVHFANAHLSTDPVHIPGNETGSVEMQVLRLISGNHYTLNVTVQKKILFGYITIPCVSGFGSCSYELCEILKGEHYNNTHHCPMEIATSSPDFECSCPFHPGTYQLNPTTVVIPKPNALSFYKALILTNPGDFHVHAKIVDTKTNEEVFCYDVYISVAPECKQASCLFGG